MDREGTRRVAGTVMPESADLVMNANPPDGRRFWLTDDMLPRDRQKQVKPTFSISTVAKVFFARSADWLRWLNSQDKDADSEEVFTLDGEPLEIKRTESGNRTWTLVDVERLAHALLQHDKIKADSFIKTINTIRWMAYNYGILPESDMRNAPPEPLIGEEQLTIDDALVEALKRLPQVDAEVIPMKEQAKAIAFSNEAYCEQCRVGVCEQCTKISACLCYSADPRMHEGMKIKHA